MKLNYHPIQARKNFLVALTFTIFVFFASFSATKLYAQTNTGGTQAVSTTSFSGQVLRRENNLITVQTSDGTKEVAVPENIKITRNSNAAKASDIQPKDQVTVIQGNNGQILSVDAIAGAVIDWAKWMIPLVALLVVLALAVWTVSRKSQKGHIRTSVT